MTAERWLLVKELFENLRSLSPELRRRSLAEIQDQELQHELQELLQSFDDSQEFLEQPAVLNAQFTSISSPVCGERLGNYALVQQVGEGGMGTVYEAHRADGEFEQRVAIKVVKQSFVNSQQIERFRAERRILAKLDHPNIGRLIDGGTTAGGLPFLVMEFVAGTRIDAYCEEHSLDVPARLELFREVCEAVEYAHAQGIVHRDLKPANVLVSAAGKPKLLDFGIAKITESGDSPTATATQFRLATPQYASPEQLRGEPTTPASDIYSLGVILYELLTGQSPGAGDEDEAHRPSKITGIRSWRRSLDRIAIKALRQNPEARYVNVRDLISDIDLFFEGRGSPPASGNATQPLLHAHKGFCRLSIRRRDSTHRRIRLAHVQQASRKQTENTGGSPVSNLNFTFGKRIPRRRFGGCTDHTAQQRQPTCRSTYQLDSEVRNGRFRFARSRPKSQRRGNFGGQHTGNRRPSSRDRPTDPRQRRPSAVG